MWCGSACCTQRELYPLYPRLITSAVRWYQSASPAPQPWWTRENDCWVIESPMSRIFLRSWGGRGVLLLLLLLLLLLANSIS